MAEAPDHYAVLGVDRGAEPEVVDAAYRALARKYHPDVNRSPDAADRTRRLNEAYRILHDPEARARYDAGLRLAAVRVPARSAVPRGADRPVDLFGAAVGDVWRRARATSRRAEAPAERAGAQSRGGVVRRWMVPALALAAGFVAGAAGATALPGRSGGVVRAYWATAAQGRAAVIEARQAYLTLTAGGYAAVAGNASFTSVATRLIAALDGATARLRGAGAIPAEAEAYHFLQLDDWREERELRVAQREAIQNRDPDAWALAAERGLAWQTSALHEKAEAAAANLAALASRG